MHDADGGKCSLIKDLKNPLLLGELLAVQGVGA